MATEGSALNGHPPTWKIWENPIVRRYARSRLRPRSLGVALLITLMLAAFLFFTIRAMADRPGMSRSDVARVPLIALLVLQGLILFVLATGQMAAAMTAEADEGVIDYQRLAPMTPLAKVIGYLFGLPIREYVLFLATMPFTLFCLVRGQVPMEFALQLYGVFLVAAVLYHLTGLVAGTVLKNRRWAFLSSMGLVFVLYTIVPQASKMGLGYFKYVTIEPVFKECLPHLLPRAAGAGVQTLQNLVPPARFFNLDLPQAVFTLGTQFVLIGVLIVMLWRRWHRAESHLLGKFGATGLFAWVQVMLLGNALPLIERGDVFPSSAMRRYFQFREGGQEWAPEPIETVFMAGAFGLVTLLMLWLMISLMTPNRDRQIRGWRRTRKLGQRSLSIGSDPATTFPWVAIMVMMVLVYQGGDRVGLVWWHRDAHRSPRSLRPCPDRGELRISRPAGRQGFAGRGSLRHPGGGRPAPAGHRPGGDQSRPLAPCDLGDGNFTAGGTALRHGYCPSRRRPSPRFGAGCSARLLVLAIGGLPWDGGSPRETSKVTPCDCAEFVE